MLQPRIRRKDYPAKLFLYCENSKAAVVRKLPPAEDIASEQAGVFPLLSNVAGDKPYEVKTDKVSSWEIDRSGVFGICASAPDSRNLKKAGMS
jgi:hypothetical protein